MHKLVVAVVTVFALFSCGAHETFASDGTVPSDGGDSTGVGSTGNDAGPIGDPAGASVSPDAGRIDAGPIDAGAAVAPDAGHVDAGSSLDGDAGVLGPAKKVFVIAMENQAAGSVYGSPNAPFLNATLMAHGGHATQYGDVLDASVPSEPHYVWLEAGTNVFADHTFTNDGDVTATNSTKSTAHLVTQLGALPTPKTWRAYQEGLDSDTGACPISSSSPYAAKHDPFVFFTDVSGNPPSKTNSSCAAHHRPFNLSDFQADLAANDVADYTFITPGLCNDMHGGVCSNGCLGSLTIGTCVKAGDSWLAAVVPSILSYLSSHDGVLLVVWDEPQTTGPQPFVIVGPHVKQNFTSTRALGHRSYLKSLQQIFGVPVFSNVAASNDFAEFFEPGHYP